MYKIIDTIDRYPHVVLLLLDITTGDKRYWCFSVLYADELCEQYHVNNLNGLTLNHLPQHGGWIEEQDINKI